MQNDAKLGMVAGLGLVVAIALVFFHKDPLDAGTKAQRNEPGDPPVVKTMTPRPASGTAIAGK